jgi:hypothetical protein
MNKAFAAAVALLVATAPTTHAAPAVTGHDVTLTLVPATGSLVPGTVARVLVIDGLVRGESTAVHEVRPDALGRVAIDFPDDDPYVLDHPAQRAFNVEVDIAVPTAHGPHLVAAATFVFDRVTQREVTVRPLSGSRIDVPVAGLDAPPIDTYDIEDCDRDMAAYECATVRYPSELHDVPIPFAVNAGAGYDTTLQIDWDHAGRIQTSTAASFGVEGDHTAVEVEGSQSVNNSYTQGVTFGGGGVRYGNTNEYATIHTEWSETQRYYCTRPSWPYSGPAQCNPDGTFWNPVDVTGSGQTVSPDPDNPLWHDRVCVFGCAVPDNVCMEDFYDDYTLGHGAETERGYSVKFSVNVAFLHASATYTRSVGESTTTVYHYHAQNPPLHKHALFVHAEVSYDDTKRDGGICPNNHIGDAWTTTDETVVTLGPSTTQDQANQVSYVIDNDSPSRYHRKVGHCAYNPEDCRPTDLG